jgi:hypothetical protein
MAISLSNNEPVVRSSSSLGDDDSAVNNDKTPPITTTDMSALEDLSRDLRREPEARAAFLATFSAEEEKKIMRKVDIRFCLLIGVMFMVKNVGLLCLSIRAWLLN